MCIRDRLWADYGKHSHAEALASAGRLRERLLALTERHTIPVSVFQADATGTEGLVAASGAQSVDIVITDVPYNRLSTWQTTETVDPLWRMLEALRPVLAPGAVVAVASDKGQTPAHDAYRRAGRFQIGKRRIVLLKPVLSTD